MTIGQLANDDTKHICSGVILHQGKALLLHETREKRKRESPRIVPFGGALKHGEKLDDAFNRELKEELGPDILIEFLQDIGEFPSDSPKAKDLVFHMRLFKWVSGNPVNAEPKQHETFEWVDKATFIEYLNKGWLVANLIYSKEEVLKHLI